MFQDLFKLIISILAVPVLLACIGLTFGLVSLLADWILNHSDRQSDPENRIEHEHSNDPE